MKKKITHTDAFQQIGDKYCPTSAQNDNYRSCDRKLG